MNRRTRSTTAVVAFTDFLSGLRPTIVRAGEHFEPDDPIALAHAEYMAPVGTHPADLIQRDREMAARIHNFNDEVR